jgi:hypothetical protein
MSVASLNATIATLESKGIPYRLHASPMTGQLAVYTQSIVPSMRTAGLYDPINLVAGSPGNAMDGLTQQFQSNGYDSYCDGDSTGRPAIEFFSDSWTETYNLSIWHNTVIALDTGELSIVKLSSDGQVANLAIQIHIAVFVDLILAIILAVMVLAIVWMVAPKQQLYNYYDLYGNATEGTREQYLSTQAAKYWYVCGKDGAGFAPKSQYSTPPGTSSDEYKAFKAHCDMAGDIITPTDNGFFGIIVAIGAVLAITIGGVAVLKSGVLKGKSKQQDDRGYY